VIWFTYAVVFELRELKGTSWIPSVMPWLEGKDQDGMWDVELEPKTFPIYQVGESKRGVKTKWEKNWLLKEGGKEWGRRE
jgi:hypothetical protein